MIEWLLLQPSQSGYVTHFFDGRYVFYWPEASLSQIKDPTEDYLDIASRDALIAYRQSGDARNHAYQAYLAQKETM